MGFDLEEIKTKKTFIGLGLGQILSLLLTCNVFTSSELVRKGSRGGGSNPVKGDVLVIAGATLYAVSNTSEEFLVKSADTVELITFMGLFGAIISGIQTYPTDKTYDFLCFLDLKFLDLFVYSCILEHDELKAIDWSAEVVQLVV